MKAKKKMKSTRKPTKKQKMASSLCHQMLDRRVSARETKGKQKGYSNSLQIPSFEDLTAKFTFDQL